MTSLSDFDPEQVDRWLKARNLTTQLRLIPGKSSIPFARRVQKTMRDWQEANSPKEEKSPQDA
jgi:hypothetical protein